MQPAVCVLKRGFEPILDAVQRAGASKLRASLLRQTIRPFDVAER